MTTPFTADNSDFSGDDLDTINQAFDALISAWGTHEQSHKSLCDALTNAWQDGNTVAELIATVEAQHLDVPLMTEADRALFAVPTTTPVFRAPRFRAEYGGETRYFDTADEAWQWVEDQESDAAED